ncbi:MAG: hypothetical protein KDB03_02820 [Planctomycetales bacterium]|nr:hypothetical protein [Planctomycetales bacterium]
MFNCKLIKDCPTIQRRQGTGRLLGLVAIVCGSLLIPNGGAAAQGNKQNTLPSPTETEQELMQDLLDLITPPVLTPSQNDATAKPPQIQPNEVGLTAEEVSANSMPLEAVRQSMLIASGFLRQGFTGAETLQLQGDIVQRLDELIATLDQDDRSEQTAKSQQQLESSTKAQEPQPSQDAQREKSTRQGEDSVSKQSTPSQLGHDGDSKSDAAHVNLLDPRALQQNVWGHLPEKIRQQMRAHMVEEFLPSYREQIEAYFQALLQAEK